MRDKFLYFGLNAAGTEAFNNVDCSGTQTFQLTTSFVNPIPTGENFLANGGAKVTVTAHANHAFGSNYGSPAAGDEVDITAACTIHASNGTITVSKTGANGFTGDGTTAANNDFDVTQLKPYDDGDCMVYNSRHLKGIASITTSSTVLNFKAKTGDANSVDIMAVAHGTRKHKAFMKQVAELVADPRPVSGMVVIADDMRSIVMPHDEAGITSVTPTFDGA